MSVECVWAVCSGQCSGSVCESLGSAWECLGVSGLQSPKGGGGQIETETLPNRSIPKRSREHVARCRQRVQHGLWALKIEAISKPKYRAMSKSIRSNRDLPCADQLDGWQCATVDAPCRGSVSACFNQVDYSCAESAPSDETPRCIYGCAWPTA